MKARKKNICSKKEGDSVDRVILHSDLNNFYASVECVTHPEYRGGPLLVCGDVELRHGIVLAKNETAKAAGVKTGMAVWEAKQLCPTARVVPPNMPEYIKYSNCVRAIYREYTNQVEPFGLDECWLDVTGSGTLFGDGLHIAQSIRRRIKKELGVTVSVGVSFNKVFAKLGSDYKKPDAVTLFSRENYKQKVWPLPAADLLYVGRATDKKLRNLGIRTIGDIAATDERVLTEHFGKTGLMLYRYACGLDRSPVLCTGEAPPVKSVGNSTTPPRDLVNNEDVKRLIFSLSETVGARLREHGCLADTVEIWVRSNDLISFTRQHKLAYATRLSAVIAREAYSLFLRSYRWANPIRSLGVRVSGLSPDCDPRQTTLFRDEERLAAYERLEDAVDDLRRRYGFYSVTRGVSLCDDAFGVTSPADARTESPSMYEIHASR